MLIDEKGGDENRNPLLQILNGNERLNRSQDI